MAGGLLLGAGPALVFALAFRRADPAPAARGTLAAALGVFAVFGGWHSAATLPEALRLYPSGLAIAAEGPARPVLLGAIERERLARPLGLFSLPEGADGPDPAPADIAPGLVAVQAGGRAARVGPV